MAGRTADRSATGFEAGRSTGRPAGTGRRSGSACEQAGDAAGGGLMELLVEAVPLALQFDGGVRVERRGSGVTGSFSVRGDVADEGLQLAGAAVGVVGVPVGYGGVHPRVVSGYGLVGEMVGPA